MSNVTIKDLGKTRRRQAVEIDKDYANEVAQALLSSNPGQGAQVTNAGEPSEIRRQVAAYQRYITGLGLDMVTSTATEKADDDQLIGYVVRVEG